MIGLTSERLWGLGLLSILSLVGIIVSIASERGSEERANRLYREGALSNAAIIYGSHIQTDSMVARLHYNLGTTLLSLQSPSAPSELASTASSENEELRSRALYNLGLWSLMQAIETEVTDSVRAHASNSVEANKGALRIEPGRLNARWNLSLAQRMLDSLDADDGRAGEESVDGQADTDELVLSEELREIDDDDGGQDGPDEGEDEALAQSDDLEPLSTLEADEILGLGHLAAAMMIRKLLALEGRSLRRQRLGATGPRW